MPFGAEFMLIYNPYVDSVLREGKAADHCYSSKSMTGRHPRMTDIHPKSLQARPKQRYGDKRGNMQITVSRNRSTLIGMPPELLLEIVGNLGPADKASLALTCKRAYQFSNKSDFQAMDVPQISEIWSRACHEPFPMEYERYRFLQRLQGDSRKYVACAWCLELHPRKRNCSVGCASRFASERRIKVDETTCEWQIMHNGRSNGIYISNFKNVDEESEEFITHNADQVSEPGEKYITIRVDHDKVFDRDDFFGPQLKNSSIRVCDHLKFPENPDLWDMVYCKVMNHPENLSCHKCANVLRHCDKCEAIFDFNVQPLDMLGELSQRYVILQARVFRRINMKLGSRAKIRAIESSR
ncbi:predicted protein [Histoplasma capsulatum G186AR]|uniref:F-box domain-containing protein n=1 Tax=Ajellomyces capsulatus (strain G186AR / H82 / ATCC MYA-2454 / RMSCC 2432) TaxID=447093 RepID=C0NMU8_AJECG|nr:uncharacterized protein HCBG_04075 [Histoplasma capsulatum G186AR]EEH07196.1 predicted protein [Histoplasma capsulatum G186AR]